MKTTLMLLLMKSGLHKQDEDHFDAVADEKWPS